MEKFQMNKPYNIEVLHKLQKTQLGILKDFMRICKKHNLQFFALYGTAIGAIRHKGFIPWDDDLDVGMMRQDYEKFLTIAKQELGERYQIMTPLEHSQYGCTVTHLQLKHTKFIPVYAKHAKCPMCIDIDIFPFDFVADDEKRQKKQSRNTNILGRLLFLSANKTPVIPNKGVVGQAMRVACIGIHYGLKLCRVTPQRIYKSYVKEATAFATKGGKYVTSFEYANGLKDKILYEAALPTYEVPFEDIMIPMLKNGKELLEHVYGDYTVIPKLENQINHAPYMIQFEGEKPIYCE